MSENFSTPRNGAAVSIVAFRGCGLEQENGHKLTIGEIFSKPGTPKIIKGLKLDPQTAADSAKFGSNECGILGFSEILVKRPHATEILATHRRHSIETPGQKAFGKCRTRQAVGG